MTRFRKIGFEGRVVTSWLRKLKPRAASVVPVETLTACPVHESVMELLNERKANADEDRKQIKEAVKELAERQTKGFEAVFRKLDGMDSYLRNGSKRPE